MLMFNIDIETLDLWIYPRHYKISLFCETFQAYMRNL